MTDRKFNLPHKNCSASRNQYYRRHYNSVELHSGHMSHLVLAIIYLVAILPRPQALKASPSALRATQFNEATGSRECPASRGTVHANTEDALSACEQSDHCTHGTRCLPCALKLPVECDVGGASIECRHSFMCDATTAAVERVNRWQLHDNRIQSNAPQPPDLN